MRNPRKLYEIDTEVAARLAEMNGAPVLVHAVRGFVDSGSVAAVISEHLVSSSDPLRLATFEVDELLDYRSRRPAMTFASNAWVDVDAPELVIDVVPDAEGTQYLLLHGLEPDTQWERFAAATTQIIEDFGVSLVVGVHGIPMAVPHTRELSATVHGTRPELVADFPSWFGNVQVPGSASSLLELRLGEAGHDAVGLAVHVPHYLASSTYPAAAVTGLGFIERLTGLDLDAAGLEPAVLQAAEEVERQLSDSDEALEVVRALENQYDAFRRGTEAEGMLASGAPIPTAEELGDEFERFLAQQSKDPGQQ
ncbi:MAG: PAC2 family protein [Actinomycetales bacterium]|nr:PAC2 family protein [Actinomycetales bacterium]